MTLKRYDFVVVGGGQNALTETTAYLAKIGTSVAVLEQHDQIGAAVLPVK